MFEKDIVQIYCIKYVLFHCEYERRFIENMRIIVVKNEEKGAKVAFELLETAYKKGATVYGLATGGTPVDLYRLIRDSALSFESCVAINLDEYVGLSKENPHSYDAYMKKHLFNEKPFKQTFLPDGLAQEVEEVARYEQVLKENPIDFQLLGLGTNAHIGFNEPGTPFTQRTHKVALTQATIDANKRYFENEEDVPRYAYSMGLQSIMDAKEIVLLAYGQKKAQAIRDMIEGPITEDVPASILQKHDYVTVIIDEQAAALLSDACDVERK